MTKYTEKYTDSSIKCNQIQLFKRKNDTEISDIIRKIYNNDGDKQQITCH